MEAEKEDPTDASWPPHFRSPSMEMVVVDSDGEGDGNGDGDVPAEK